MLDIRTPLIHIGVVHDFITNSNYWTHNPHRYALCVNIYGKKLYVAHKHRQLIYYNVFKFWWPIKSYTESEKKMFERMKWKVHK